MPAWTEREARAALLGPPGFRAHRAWVIGAALVAAVAPALAGCDGCSKPTDEAPPGDPAAAMEGGLSAEQARQVLARIGDRTLTLGHYAAALERMDPLERIRYQTADRRQQLLDEMINVELLAREAERRGLDRRADVIALVREYQRDELLRRLNASAPKPSELPLAEVSDYYREHREQFAEPERRRGAHIEMTHEARAREVLAQARGAGPDRWRELVQEHSVAAVPAPADKTEPRPPIEVPGDLGMLERDADPAREGGVPGVIRAALFEIPEVGGVFPELVPHSGRFHIVRLASRVDARQRTLSEVEDAVRARIVAGRQAEARAALIERLRRTTQVSIDEVALERISPPSPAAAQGGTAPSP